MSYCEQKKEMVVTLVRKFCEEFGVPQQNIEIITKGVLRSLKSLINVPETRIIRTTNYWKTPTSLELDETLIRNATRTAIRDLSDNKLSIDQYENKIASLNRVFSPKKQDLDKKNERIKNASFGTIRTNIIRWLIGQNLMLETRQLYDLINKMVSLRLQSSNTIDKATTNTILEKNLHKIRKMATDLTTLSDKDKRNALNFMNTQSIVIFWFKNKATISIEDLDKVTAEAHTFITNKGELARSYSKTLLQKMLNRKYGDTVEKDKKQA